MSHEDAYKLIHPVQNVLVDTDWTDHYKHDPAFKNYFAEDGSVLDPTKFYRVSFWYEDLILVPKGKISKVLTDYHDAKSAGHWGSKRHLTSFNENSSFQTWLILLNDMCGPATFANTVKQIDIPLVDRCNR